VIRFILYVLLAATSGLGVGFVLYHRRSITPHGLATFPAFVLTGAYAALRMGKTVAFWWQADAWWQEPPLFSVCAMLVNAVVLAWALTAFVILMAKVRHVDG
jgi:hypothetical protein